MMLDATRKYDQLLTAERLFGWQASLFPIGRSGKTKIIHRSLAQRRPRPHASHFGFGGERARSLPGSPSRSG
jgi:hypothetical protein